MKIPTLEQRLKATPEEIENYLLNFLAEKPSFLTTLVHNVNGTRIGLRGVGRQSRTAKQEIAIASRMYAKPPAAPSGA
jgi:hypothetical protein